MQSLGDILSTRDFTPPNEIELVRDYIKRRYDSKCWIRVDKKQITVSVASSSLASVLRMDQRRLIEACNLKKKLVIRIGSGSY